MKEKDFIKIDDLFKGRADKEEPVPMGAWEKMSHKLDQSPTISRSYRNWRLGLTGLIAIFGIGTGLIFKNHLNNNTVNKEKTALSIANQNQRIVVPSGNENKNLSKTKKNKPSNTATPLDIHQKSLEEKKIAKNIYSPTQETSKTIPLISEKNQNQKTTTSKAKHQKRNISLAIKQERNASLMPDYAIGTNETLPSPRTINSDIDALLSHIDQESFKPKAIEDSNYLAVIKDDIAQKKYVLPKTIQEWKLEKDQKVTEIERQITFVKNKDGKNIKHIDTLNTKNYSRKVLQALSLQDKNNLIYLASSKPGMAIASKRATNNLATLANDISIAANTSNNIEIIQENNLVPLNNYKVNDKSISSSKKLIAQFQDFIDDYFKGIKPYYFGSSIGVQTAFSNPQQYGFHIGLAAFYDFKERWTLGTEIKYLHNKFNNQAWKDIYYQYSQQSIDNSGSQPIYNAYRQGYANIYHLQSASYFELPVTLRYQLNKLSFMGGLLVNYMNNIKYKIEPQQLEGNGTWVAGPKKFENTSPIIQNTDLKNRVGLGFTIGTLYDFSKNTSLDFRINQNILNNKNLKTAAFYNTTSFQLSFYYFMGRKDKVIYMMHQK
ncbi:MAG TPA: outer membrane beta-barrel protein [Edaphocola sp.]|nr:outer membrane beta-barrel protein [Edaphocola sp.]